MSTSKTIIFFGTDSFSVSALRHLIEAGYAISAVVTKPDARSGRGQHMIAPAVKVLAEENNIPVWQPTDLADIKDDIAALDQPLGVLSSFGRIIPQDIIDLFSPGIINVHPSLLPRYRGPTPIETAILNGDSETGISIMLLTAKMDAGPVYAQATYPLTGTETQADLYESLADLGSSLLIQQLPRIFDGSHTPTEQIEADATYTDLLHKEDALIAPETAPADVLARKVRAHLTFPKTKLSAYDQLITVVVAHDSDQPEHNLSFICSDGRYFVVDELVAPSGRRMNSADFLNGYTPKA